MSGEVVTNRFPSSHNKIIFFDGVCLQSNYAMQFLKEKSKDANSLKTFILVEDNSIYTRSTAALKAVKQLSGLWPLLYGFIILPPFIRDAVYNWVSSNRYNWFGKQETCWLPREEWKNRFLS